MPAFSSHHCPKCGHVGNRRCVANGHYADCHIHPGSFHSIYTECVKCVSQRQVDEQEHAALEKAKKHQDDSKNGKKKKAKTPKAKRDCEKSMKQLRKEKRERRRTGGSDEPSSW